MPFRTSTNAAIREMEWLFFNTCSQMYEKILAQAWFKQQDLATGSSDILVNLLQQSFYDFQLAMAKETEDAKYTEFVEGTGDM